MTQPSSSADASYTTSDTISLTAYAMTTGDGITYSTDGGEADLTFVAGVLSGSPTVANSPYSIEIYAEDDSCAGSCTGVSIITDTISFTVTVAGPFDANGFNATGNHRNGTIYDDDGYDIDGYNSQGRNAADYYDPLYDENVSRS